MYAYCGVEMAHTVLHIVWAHVTRDASAKARAYSRRHALLLGGKGQSVSKRVS